MSRYQTSRHRRLMVLSETALEDALTSEVPRESRIAATILGDSQKYRLWEARHADILVPVARESRKKTPDRCVTPRQGAARAPAGIFPLSARS